MIKTWIATRGPPRARKLLSHFEIGRELRVYEEHRAGRIRQQMLESLHAGQTVALISTPAVMRLLRANLSYAGRRLRLKTLGAW
jgi:hypothetical protein